MTDGDLQPQDLVLTLLGAYAREQDTRPVWSGGMVSLLAAFGFSTEAARMALARLAGRGMLKRIRDGRLVHYVPTAHARSVLREGDARIFSLGREPAWNGSWTTLWYSIPDELRLQRHRLGRRLRFHGFGSLEDGVWITPRDRGDEIVALLRSLEVTERAWVLTGRLAAALDPDAVIRQAWDIPELCERYAAFVATYATSPASGFDDGEAFRLRTQLVHDFRRFPTLDPSLPEEMAPRGWERSAAIELFHQRYGQLADAAQRHFDAVARPA